MLIHLNGRSRSSGCQTNGALAKGHGIPERELVDQRAAFIFYLDALVEVDLARQRVLADHPARILERHTGDQRGVVDLSSLGVEQRVVAVAEVEEIHGHRGLLTAEVSDRDRTALAPCHNPSSKSMFGLTFLTC